MRLLLLPPPLQGSRQLAAATHGGPSPAAAAAASGGQQAPVMRAAMLAIGNELLSGAVTDTNTPWLARLLYSRGVDLVGGWVDLVGGWVRLVASGTVDCQGRERYPALAQREAPGLHGW